jgi:cell division protease FtsH
LRNQKNLSDSTAKLIDDESRGLADEADKKCRKILQENIQELHIVAKGLLEYETLSGDEIKDLIKGVKPTRDDFDNSPTPTTTPKTSVPKTGGTAAPQTN